ncbi:hypothetical protein TSAR_010647 [Trichomalopsis sarcophagae]|uniref:Uncharacterized protein n=1 Tax=Trichomalopsis sarcophagae TaxID=543379 RepID=A0A232FAX7_9HYME|nr:hypothetical protein TSAR_010647 [Trichomalopsis sarcophagae]
MTYFVLFESISRSLHLLCSRADGNLTTTSSMGRACQKLALQRKKRFASIHTFSMSEVHARTRTGALCDHAKENIKRML